MERYGHDVHAVIEELGLDDVVLVGHSMGGDACLEASRIAGARVLGLVWVDTYGTLDVAATTPSVDELVGPLEKDFVHGARAFVGQMFLPDEPAEIAAWVIDDMSSSQAGQALASVTASLIYGRRAHALVERLEVPIVAMNTDYLGADLDSLERRGVTVHRLPGLGHFPMLTDPERFDSALTGIIASFER